jgi:hypothetical protein
VVAAVVVAGTAEGEAPAGVEERMGTTHAGTTKGPGPTTVQPPPPPSNAPVDSTTLPAVT